VRNLFSKIVSGKRCNDFTSAIVCHLDDVRISPRIGSPSYQTFFIALMTNIPPPEQYTETDCESPAATAIRLRSMTHCQEKWPVTAADANLKIIIYLLDSCVFIATRDVHSADIAGPCITLCTVLRAGFNCPVLTALY